MFEIFLCNYKSEGQLITAETKVFEIPMRSMEEPWLVNPIFKGEMGKAETFDFTLNPGTKFYDAFTELKTRVRVTYGQITIFFGRVITISKSGLLQIRSVHCEGLMSALGDIPQEGVPENQQTKKTATQYLQTIISQHNSWIGNEEWKRLYLGTVNIDARTESTKYESTSWSTTLAQLNSLVDNNGGYMRVRYYKPGSIEYHYLDWVKSCFRDLGDGQRPHVKIAKNLLDLSIGDNSGEIFTRLIPIGETSTTSSNSAISSSSSSSNTKTVYLDGNKYLTVNDLIAHYGAAELESDGFRLISDYENAENKYGIIYKTQSFPNARSSAELRNYALDWMKRNFFGSVYSYQIKAIDMHMVGDNAEPQILVGDAVELTYPTFDEKGNRTLEQTRKMVCKSVQYNLFHPEQNTYVFGIPNDGVDFEYGERKKASRSAAASAASSPHVSGGGGNKTSKLNFAGLRSYILYYYTTRKAFVSGVYGTQVRNNRTDGHFTKIYTNANPNFPRYYNIVNLNDFDTPYFAHVDPNNFPTKDPAIQFNANGPYGIVDESGESHPVYAYFSDPSATYRPTSASVFKDLVVGHYTYSSIEYGVGIKDDKYGFTFRWSDLANKGTAENNAIPVAFYFPEDDMKNAKSSIAPDAGSDAEEEAAIDAARYKLVTDGEGNQAYRWTDEQGRTAQEISDAMGGADSGYADDGSWFIRLTEPIKITMPDGSEQILTGVISEHDFHVEKIPNFNVDMAVMEHSYTKYATVGYLRAYAADLGSSSVAADVYETNPDGTIKYDSSGNPIIKPGGSDAEWAAQNFDKAYELNPDGSIKLDANGRPIPKKDQYGNPIYQLRSGTNFHTTATQLSQVAGNFYYDENGLLHLRSGGGVIVTRESAEVGIWDDGTVTGGMIVKKINRTDTETKIKGTHVVIGDDDTSDVTLKNVLSIADYSGTTSVKIENARSFLIHGANVYVVKNGTAGGKIIAGDTSFANTMISASGTLSFSGSSSNGVGTTTSLNYQKVNTLNAIIDNANQRHIAISGPENGTYTLWYLPVSYTPTVTNPKPGSSGNWINAGTFKPATSVTGVWSGSASSPTMPLTIKVHPEGDPDSPVATYVIATSGATTATRTVLNMKVSSDETPTVEGTSVLTLKVKLAMQAAIGNQFYDVSTKYVNIPAWPLWDYIAEKYSNTSQSNGYITVNYINKTTGTNHGISVGTGTYALETHTAADLEKHTASDLEKHYHGPIVAKCTYVTDSAARFEITNASSKVSKGYTYSFYY